MLQEKCNIETSSRNGWRPIHFASIIGNKEVVEFLIKNCCESNCKTNNGETVLDVANRDCDHEIINKILNENTNLRIGLLMGLKCGADCTHHFCLRSLIRPEYYIISNVSFRRPDKANDVNDLYTNRSFSMTIIPENNYDDYEIKICLGPKINEMLLNLNHTNIVKYYGLIKTGTNTILFHKWIINGSLSKNIQRNGPLNNGKMYRYCKDIVQAVVYLHDNKILHRFIHPKKILLDNNGGCKLVISNYSYLWKDGEVQLDDKWLKKYEKYLYRDPELIENKKLSYSYDIWLLGCTVIEMSTGNQQKYNLIKFDEIEQIISKIPNQMLRSFIRSMVTKDSTKRITAIGLLNHDFIRNNNYQSIFDNSLIDRQTSFERIHITIKNKQALIRGEKI